MLVISVARVCRGRGSFFFFLPKYRVLNGGYKIVPWLVL